MARRLVSGALCAVVLGATAQQGCASSDESDAVFGPGKDAGKDVKTDGSGGTKDGGGGTGGKGGTGGATGGKGGTGGVDSGGTGGGTCQAQTCPTPAPPAVKCCVTANGPCGVDYKQGAGCQAQSTGDI